MTQSLAIEKLSEVRPNVWYKQSILLAAYDHAGRHEQPEGRAAVSDYKEDLAEYTVQRIRDLYEGKSCHTPIRICRRVFKPLVRRAAKGRGRDRSVSFNLSRKPRM